MKKTKVLFLSNHFHTLFAYRKELITKLLGSDYDVFLSIPEDKNNFFHNLGCTIIITNIDRQGINFIKDSKLILFYRKIMKSINPDIIFSFTIKPNVYGCIANNNRYKQICNITGTGKAFLNDSFISKVCKLLYKISLRNCYKVFFQNTGDRDFFIQNRLLKNKYAMLPGSGCNLEENFFQKMPDQDVIKFIFVGRVMRMKGIDEYLAAAKHLKLKYDFLEFYIAGWNEEKEYQSIIKENENAGYIKYLGFREDIRDCIAGCHCTVLPSHGGEGVPNALLESAAIGRVCIGSDIHGTNDVILEGVNGYLFEAGNSKQLIEKLEMFLNLTFEEKQLMGMEGRKRVAQKYDRNQVIEKYCYEVEHAES